MIYVLRNSKGTYTQTLSANRRECWSRGFDVVASELGDEWRKKYWKRWEPSIRSARRHGYWIDKCYLTFYA
jgi:hypothetical protein